MARNIGKWLARAEEDDLLHVIVGEQPLVECRSTAICGFNFEVHEILPSGSQPAMLCVACSTPERYMTDLHRHIPSRVVIDDVMEAAVAALKKHGPPTCDAVRACAILGEELGEATELALKMTSGNPRERGELGWAARRQLLREELLQLAGYALLQIQSIDNGRMTEHVTDKL